MRTPSVPSQRLRRLPFRTHWVLAVATLTILSVAAPESAHAADPQPTPALSDHDRIKQLEETVDRLKKDTRQVEVAVENQNAKPLAGWSAANGFTLASPDGAYKLRLGGYTQADGRFFINDKANQGTSTFLFRRARLDFSGTVFKYFEFRILPDFAQPNSSSSVVLFDAYVDANYIPEAKLRVGKFKPPVGLERLQGAPYIEFIERAQPTNLVPNRDFGAQLFGDLLQGALGYQVAVVNGVADNSNPTSVDINDDKDFVGRVFALPFKDLDVDLLKGFGVGFAGSFGRESANAGSPDLPNYKTFGQATYFQYSGANTTSTPPKGPTIANGHRDRWSPQFYYYWSSFGLLGEYVNSTEGVIRDNKKGRVSNYSWQIAGSYVLTGEVASYRGVNPANPFDPFTGKWGAWELVARFSQLQVDNEAFAGGFANPATSANRDNEAVVGINWYLNRNIKLSLDFADSRFQGGNGKGNRPDEYAVVEQVQLLL